MKIEQTQQPLQVLVIGANGGVGRQSVEIGLDAGHHVTALLRDPAKLVLRHPNLELVQGDIMYPETFERCLANKDVVISAIGGKMNEPTTLFSLGAINLLKAMQKMDVKRAFFISSAAIEISPAQPFYIRLVTKYVVQQLFGLGYADQRIMEKIIKESDTVDHHASSQVDR